MPRMPPVSPSSSIGHSSADERIQEEAALWFARLRGERVTTARRAAFAVWLEADKRHRDEYETLERIWEQSTQLAQRAAKPPRKRTMQAAATLAGLAFLCAWLGFAWFDGRMATEPGERRHVRLADGSELDIAPNTRLKLRFDSARRRLDLDEGQIVVSVAADPQRPFEIAAGGGMIRDIGTRFEVSTGQEQTRIVVAEGMVEVSGPAMGAATPLRIGAGEAMEFDSLRVLPVRRVDAAASLGWTSGQLAFDAAPLADVAAALNRYRRAPIVLNDPTLSRIRISGVFLIDDEAAALRAIERVAPVRFVPNGARMEARPAEQAR